MVLELVSSVVTKISICKINKILTHLMISLISNNICAFIILHTNLYKIQFSDTVFSPSKTMDQLSLVMKYDEHFRHVLALLDTTVERGT